MIPSPPVGSLVKHQGCPFSKLRTAHISQLPTTSRGRMLPKPLSGLPVHSCSGLRINFSISLSPIARLLKRLTCSFMPALFTGWTWIRISPNMITAWTTQLAMPRSKNSRAARPWANSFRQI